MAITKPIIAEIAHKTWCINEFGMNSLYLLEGDKKALLIDTGTGTFDIPVLIRQLTEKPLDVALTHGHIDHVGGMGFFNEVYIHPDDMPLSSAIQGKWMPQDLFCGEHLEACNNHVRIQYHPWQLR